MEQSKQLAMEAVLIYEKYQNAFHVVTGTDEWKAIHNDRERENILYKTYFEYYDLIYKTGVVSIPVKTAYIVMHQIRLQLEQELINLKG